MNSFWGIFWIDASSVETAEQDLAKLAKIDGFGDTSEDGKTWLTSLEVSWMLIIDNADDPSVDVSRFFPSGDRGHILVTSRNSECRYHETVGYQELKEMNHEEADTLLLKAAGKDTTNSRLRRLARPITSTLGYLPLALDQAGATIRQNICTLETYLSLYHRQRRQIMSMRSIQGGEAYKYTVYSTWEVSFKMIQKLEKPAAVDACEILQIFAFLHFQQVPANVLQKAWENPSRPRVSAPSKSLISRFMQAFHLSEGPNSAPNPPRILFQEGPNWDTIRFQRALWILRQFSLIVKDADMDEDRTPTSGPRSWGSYSMHPLVHFWARDRLSKEDQNLWFDVTTTVVADSISTHTDAAEYAYRRSLIPHIDCFFGGDHTEPLIGKGTPYRQTEKGIKLAQVYFEGGRFQSARELQEKVVEERTTLLGPDDPDTLQAMTSLGSSYWNIGLMDKAAEIQRSVMEARINTLGPNHPDTLKSIDKLADTYWLCGRMVEAQELGITAMAGMNEVFGPSDIITLTSTLNLARVYKHRGQFEKARELQARVQGVCMEKFGLENTLTLRASMELGTSYCDLGRLEEAEKLLQTVVLAKRRVLGKEHAYTLWALNDLAKIYCAQNRPVEAEEILVEVLEAAQRTLGREHIGTRMTMINLARAYSGQRRWLDTENLLNALQDILMRKINAKEVDPLHPDWLVLRQEMSRNYANQGRIIKAQKLLSELIPMMDKKLGPEHPRTQSTKKQLLK